MKSVKGFLLAYFGVYIAISIVLNVMYGPPGMSGEYLSKYKADHERYLSISKSADYKLYEENSGLNPPADDRQARDFAFVEEYTAREEYQQEMQRRSRYDLLFDFLRAAMVLVLVVRFGGAPLMRYLDSQVQHVRDRLGEAAETRRAAQEREAAAKAQLAAVDSERARLIAEAEERVAAEAAQMQVTAEQALAMIAQEQEDRVRNEELMAKRALKKELVEEALRILEADYAAKRTPESEAALVDKFVEQMELVR